MGIHLPTLLRLVILIIAGSAHHSACTAPNLRPFSTQFSEGTAEHAMEESVSEKSTGSNGGGQDGESISHDKFAFAVGPFLRMLSVSKYALWTLIGFDGARCILLMLHPSRIPATLSPIVASFAVNEFSQPHPTSLLPLLFLAGATLIISGWRLRKACFDALGKQFTLRHKMFRRHHLITTGPYRFVRHPGYVGILLVRVGALCMTLSKGSWMHTTGAIPWPLNHIFLDGLSDSDSGNSLMIQAGRAIVRVYAVHAALELFGLFCVRAAHEDAVLKGRFDKEWTDYRERVPWMFVPYII